MIKNNMVSDKSSKDSGPLYDKKYHGVRQNQHESLKNIACKYIVWTLMTKKCLNWYGWIWNVMSYWWACKLDHIWNTLMQISLTPSSITWIHNTYEVPCFSSFVDHLPDHFAVSQILAFYLRSCHKRIDLTCPIKYRKQWHYVIKMRNGNQIFVRKV